MSIYGLLIGIAVVLGIELIRRSYKKLSYLNILCILLSALIGARALFLLHNLEEIKQGTVRVFSVWDGGLAFYGGLIGILLSLLLISKYKKIKLLELTDSVLIFLPLIHAIGRIGNFFNYELYGKPTPLPWGIYIPVEYRIATLKEFSHFHPVFLYESILNILSFLILFFVRKKSNQKGLITGIYFVNYALIRLFMNTLRIDKEFFINLETSDILSCIFLVFGILLLLINMKNEALKNSIAHFLSKIVTLSLVFTSILSLLLNSKVSLELNILLALFTLLIPILTMVLFKKFGITSDLNVTNREERPKLFTVISISLLISLFISLFTSQPTLILIYAILNLSFFWGFLITFFWKISFHMIWSTTAIFVIIYIWQIPQLYLLTLLLPLIGWSRLQLKRHTLPQVLVGFFLTISCILIVLTLLKF